MTRCIGLFECAGADLTIVSAGKGLAHAVTEGTVKIDAVLGDIDVSRFGAIVLFDSPLVFKYPNDPRIHTIVRAAVGQGKVLGAVYTFPAAVSASWSGVITNPYFSRNATSPARCSS